MTDDDLEADIKLLGVTGLEDLLQDNVKECIADMRKAKIKVWMLTGDKGETAQNIGISCGLIDETLHQMVTVEQTDKANIKEEIARSLRWIDVGAEPEEIEMVKIKKEGSTLANSHLARRSTLLNIK